MILWFMKWDSTTDYPKFWLKSPLRDGLKFKKYYFKILSKSVESIINIFFFIVKNIDLKSSNSVFIACSCNNNFYLLSKAKIY